MLDVKILDWPCHAAGKPVAMIPNCAATRHAHFTLDGSGPSYLEAPDLDDWPKVDWQPDSAAKRVDLDTLTPEEVQSWKAGDRLLLNGAMLTGRDAAHKRIQDMLAKGEELPVELQGPRDLLRRPGRSGHGRSGRPGRPDHRDADGQVHRHDARARPAGDDRQGRARAGRGAGDRQAQGRLPDGGRRRGLSRRARDQGGQGGRRSRTSGWRRSTNSPSRTCR